MVSCWGRLSRDGSALVLGVLLLLPPLLGGRQLLGADAVRAARGWLTQRAFEQALHEGELDLAARLALKLAGPLRRGDEAALHAAYRIGIGATAPSLDLAAEPRLGRIATAFDLIDRAVLLVEDPARLLQLRLLIDVERLAPLTAPGD